MTIRMHRSTDLGAAVMTGQQGKMNALLLEVLCKGVPASAPTSITQTGGLATCTKTAHGYLTGQTVTIYGCAQTEYNGNQVISVTGADTFTFAVASGAVSPATGTITVGGQKTIGEVDEEGMTRSGTTVTVGFVASHGFSVGNRVWFQGAEQPEYNGWQTVVTVPDTYTATFELPAAQTPASPATGTIIARYGDAGLGWSVAFSGTNKTIFKQGVSGAKNQAVLVVDETVATNGAYGVGMSMAEGATALATLVNPAYSTESPTYTGMFKSGTADATARAWVAIGDHRTLIILTKPVITSSGDTAGWVYSYFGDFTSYLPNDNYPMLCAPMSRHSGYTFSSLSTMLAGLSGNTGNMSYADFAAACGSGTSDIQQCPVTTRTHLGAIGNVFMLAVCMGNSLSSNSSSVGRGSYRLGDRNGSYSADTYPDPVHGGINLEKLYLVHRTTINAGDPVTRGEVRGLWNPAHRRSQVGTWANNDTFAGTGELAGKTFEVFYSAASASSWWIVETSDTWSA